MSRNDAEDFAQRLYARVPGHYRAYDQEQGLPLLALLRVIGEQVANVRADLDALWDNFFIETCDDWVVPYIAALVGTNLLAHPVGQSNRLDVRNTVVWRRNKGTPQMLTALARDISGWPVDLVEFFQTLGWSQNLNHLRLSHPLTVDVHNVQGLGLIGHASDPFAHASDFKPARALDRARTTPDSLGIGNAAWGTPGRHQIKNVGFFARRLDVFPVDGATPAAVQPGLPQPADAACFTFDPLFRNLPLFVKSTGAALTRAQFGAAPWETFGEDVAVRQFGILLANDAQPQPSLSSGRNAFNFGGAAAGLSLHATAGIRLMETSDFRPTGVHFTIAAEWRSGGPSVTLGSLSTLEAVSGGPPFHPGAATPGSGSLVITVATGFAGLPAVGPASFPGAILSVRAVTTGPLRQAGALYIYLPAGYVTPSAPLTFHVAEDGSTFTNPNLNPGSLARESEGQVYPARIAAAATTPASAFNSLSRKPGGMQIPDPTRFGGMGVSIRADICTPVFQAIGTIATPALTYVPSTASLNNTLPSAGILSIHVEPLSGTFLPASELIVANRSGQSLLIYLPEVTGVPAGGIDLLVASDGSTYFAPSDQVTRLRVINDQSFANLPLARAGLGQVLPLPDTWPIQHRRPVAINLCNCVRRTLLAPGELGIDPELGRFALPPGDPATGSNALTVDYAEAFSDRIGALNFDPQIESQAKATRLVSKSGEGPLPLPIHTSLAAALAAAADLDVIEILDSATYMEAVPTILASAAVKKLIIRAGRGQRPCLAYYTATGAPTPASLEITVPMDSLDFSGLLLSGGPVRIGRAIGRVHFTASTIDPRTAATGALIVADQDAGSLADYLFCRCIVGNLQLGAGVSRVTLADSIVDGSIGGVDTVNEAAGFVQLERVTALGRVRCDVLSASDTILDDLAIVNDRQSGCVRFNRYETGSILPRRFQCLPAEEDARPGSSAIRFAAPLFSSRLWGRPDYLQLAAGGPAALLTTSEDGAEPGAFAGKLNTIRLGNLSIKLREFMPVGLTAVVVAET